MPEASEPRRQPVLARDPVIDAYKRDVDLTLSREQRRRTVDKRVARMIAALRLAEELHAARGRKRS